MNKEQQALDHAIKAYGKYSNIEALLKTVEYQSFLAGWEAKEQDAVLPEWTKADGVQLIAEERQRQIEVEGWTAEHDAQYEARELLRAAYCYMIADLNYYKNSIVPQWPWKLEWWKPTPNDRIRELQKAGALIAAEIDRLQTVATKSQKS